MSDVLTVSVFKRCEEKVENNKLILSINSESFVLYKDKDSNFKLCLGRFPTVNELYSFLCGYDWNKEKIDISIGPTGLRGKDSKEELNNED